LSNAEERYRLVFEANPLPSWVFDTASLQFLTVNEAAVQLYGYSAEDFLRLRITDILPENGGEILVAFLETRHERELPEKHRRADGTVIDVMVSTREMMWDDERPARLAVVRDVTAEFATLQELRESAERYRDLFESSNDLIQSVNPWWRDLYESWTDAACLR